jgi:hypothetical protein
MMNTPTSRSSGASLMHNVGLWEQATSIVEGFTVFLKKQMKMATVIVYC